MRLNNLILTLVALVGAVLTVAGPLRAQTPDFAHSGRPHTLGKNPFASPDQLDQFQQVKPRLGQLPLLVILLEFSDSTHRAEKTPAYFEELVFGGHPSVNGYYQEVSYNKFSFRNAGVSGWHRSPSPAGTFFGASATSYNTVCAEAVRLAGQAGFPFRRFDANGNGEVDRDELVILVVVADHGPIGLPQLMSTRFNHNGQGVVTPDGVEVDTFAVRVEENLYSQGVLQARKGMYISYYAHELGHAALGLADLYDDNFGEDTSDFFTLMATAGTPAQPHFEPWAKIHLGWVTPRVVTTSGWQKLKAVEANPEVIVLYDPARGPNEYFILENRWPRSSVYEQGADNPDFLDRGLAVWHIVENQDNQPFDFLRGRKMIGMKWANGANSQKSFPFTSAWDGAKTATAHNWSDSSTPRTARWADGAASGFRVMNIGAAGPEMEFYVQVQAGQQSAPALLASPSGLTFSAAAGGLAPAAQVVRLSNSGGGNLNWTVSTDAAWLSVRRGGSAVQGGTLGAGAGAVPWLEVAVNPAGLAGTVRGNVRLDSNGGAVTIPVTLSLVAAPAISAAGIVNAASNQAGVVTPGMLISIYGQRLGPAGGAGLQLSAAGLVETVVAGTQVLFDGVAAPLAFVHEGQVNAVVPYAVAGRSVTQVVVEVQGVRSNAVNVAVAEASPAVFTANQSGSGPGAIFNQDGSANSVGNKARGGSIVIFFATGEGQTEPAGVDGKLAVSELPKPRLPVRVRIGGRDAEVLYAGAAPGFLAGLMQINAQVPMGVAGDALPLNVIVGNNASRQSVTVAVE